MYHKKTIGVVIPCYNEEKQINKVVTTIPRFVDKIVVIDDCCKDKTSQVVNKLSKKNKKIILIKHPKNKGVGGAIASGYKWCRDNGIEVAAVMAGDGQMLPQDLSKILDPVVDDRADYTKANRLISGVAYQKIPKPRYFGNSVLSFLTKISSGYWHVMDSQSGYTAINKKMLKLIDWDKMYTGYGQPNDLLVRLNVYNAQVGDVILDPVYGVGESSNLKISKALIRIPKMLIKMFFWRLKEKYIIRDFHPLVLFYFFGMLFGFLGFLLMIRWIYFWAVNGDIPRTNFLAWMMSTLSSIQLLIFAMWFDMDYNRELKARDK